MALSAWAVSSTSSGQLKKPGQSTSRKSARRSPRFLASAVETTLTPSALSCADSSAYMSLWAVVPVPPLPEAGRCR